MRSGKTHMRSLALAILLSLLGLCSSLAESNLEMTCEHTVVPEMPETILYITLHNKGTEPVDVITCLPSAGVAVRGGAWSFHLQSTWYAEDNGTQAIPIRERLLPVTIPPHQRITFTQRSIGQAFDKIPPIGKDTYVRCVYKVWDRDAKRYGVWGGELSSQSTYVPFYKDQ
jgi:hypothetical protein